MTPDPVVQAFEIDFPDDELVVYRNEVTNVECLIAMPKAKVNAVIAGGGKPPYWRHGEVIHVKRAEASA